MTKPGENERVIAEVTKWNKNQPPDVVWANAGAARPGLFLETPEEIMRSQMELNYWAANSLARATLKAWTTPTRISAMEDSKDSSPRQFVITSSIACFIGIAGYAPYSPAKAALRSLADTLRSELNLYNGMRRAKDASIRAKAPDRDISIHFVAPGTIDSPGLQTEDQVKPQVTKELEKDDGIQTEDEVAAAAIAGLEAGGFIITTLFSGHAMRAAALGPSPKNNWFLDILFSWVAAVIWLFVTPDLEGKVYQYGRQHGTANATPAQDHR